MMPRSTARFAMQCSREIFSDAEIRILERFGREFVRLSNGLRRPETAAQHRFVEVANGRAPAETIYEKTWNKYLQRVAWESDPANRAAMGPLRRVPDDRDDWRRMNAATWGDIRQRARGHD